MDHTYLFIGLSLIALGLLVKKFPNLIAGYNTMTKEQKENIDIKGLSTNMRNAFILTGLVVIIGFYSLAHFELYRTAEYVANATIIVGIVYVLATSKKYDLRQKNKN